MIYNNKCSHSEQERTGTEPDPGELRWTAIRRQGEETPLMQAILNGESTLIVAMIVAYIAFTAWLTIKLRSRTSDQFMTGARAMPAVVVGVLMMSEFVGAKSTVGTAQEAFQSGMAAGWAVLGASIGFLLFGTFIVSKLYG